MVLSHEVWDFSLGGNPKLWQNMEVQLGALTPNDEGLVRGNP
jgi:hypothetical protein